MASLKRSWRTFAAAPAGRRFRAANRRQRGHQHGLAKRLAWVALGLVLILVGGFLMVVPGPGIPVVLIGGALIARQSYPVARALDAGEVLVRRIWRWVSHAWQKAPLGLKAALVILVLAAAGGAAGASGSS